MSLRKFTVNLVSIASMATFPESELAHFTSLLPQQLNLTGFREVVLAENACPAAIQNMTSGQFKYRVAPEARNDNDISNNSSRDTPKGKLNGRPFRMVTICELPIRPVQEAIIEKVGSGSIKPGVYLTFGQFLRSICKKVFREDVDDIFPFSWNLDVASDVLKL